MTKWTASDLPVLNGRTVVATGASGGIGLVAARELARAGAHVVLAVRDVRKGQSAADGMEGNTEVRQLDVADLASVRAFADAWDGPLDVLINNAGIMQVPFARTADGFESQLATNYLGPFALTGLLLPHITDRVVMLSSQMHRTGHANLEDMNFESRRYRPLAAYADSKLYETMFALELQRRLTAAGSKVRVMAAHPGLAKTNLFSHRADMTAAMHAMGFMFQKPDKGALPTLFAATQDIPGGSFVGPDGFAALKGYPEIARPSRAARDTDTANRLWDASVQMTGINPLPSSITQ